MQRATEFVTRAIMGLRTIRSVVLV